MLCDVNVINLFTVRFHIVNSAYRTGIGLCMIQGSAKKTRLNINLRLSQLIAQVRFRSIHATSLLA